MTAVIIPFRPDAPPPLAWQDELVSEAVEALNSSRHLSDEETLRHCRNLQRYADPTSAWITIAQTLELAINTKNRRPPVNRMDLLIGAALLAALVGLVAAWAIETIWTEENARALDAAGVL